MIPTIPLIGPADKQVFQVRRAGPLFFGGAVNRAVFVTRETADRAVG